MALSVVLISKLTEIALIVGVSLTLLGATDQERDILAVQDAVQSGDLAAATRLIQAALKQHPNDGGLLNLSGVIHAQKNEIPEARSDFERAVRLSPSLTPAWQNLARACQLALPPTTDSASCAIRSWQRVIQLDPANAEARKSLATLYAQQGKYLDSLREIRALPQPEAASTPILLLKCADLAALRRTQEAQSLVAQLNKQPDLSDDLWPPVSPPFDTAPAAPVVATLVEALQERQAAGPASLRSLAIAYENLGRIPDAQKTLERVAALDSKNTAPLIELARLADAAGNHEGALGYLAHARDLAPNDAHIHFLFAKIAVEMNLPIEARASLSKALALDPENPAYNYAMGFVILSTRDAATAGGYFQKFVKANPKNANGHYALGIAYFASGDLEKSKAEMQLVQSDPKTAGGAEYFLGRIARQEGDAEAAAGHLHRSISLLSDFAESHTELARLYLLQKNFAAARAELDVAIRIDPQSFPANEQLLVLYKRTHDPAAEKQEAHLKELDADRSKRAELMLRTVEARP
jgi:tetratricopeptide (TPR) repeat protein